MQPVEKFGKFVVSKLRDMAVDHADGLLSGRWKSPGSQALQTALAGLNDDQRQIVRRCVLDSVDTGIHDLLFALAEANDFDSGIAVLVDGVDVAAESDGLQAEPFSNEGWFARFSKHGPHADPA